MTLMVVYETVRTLLNECAGHLRYARLVASTTSPDQPGPDEWAHLLGNLHTYECEVNQMMVAFRLDHPALHGVYETMLSIQDRWAQYRIVQFAATVGLPQETEEQRAQRLQKELEQAGVEQRNRCSHTSSGSSGSWWCVRDGRSVLRRIKEGC